MRRILLITIVLLSLGVQAQNGEPTVQDILNYKSCYDKLKSHGLQEKSIDVEGEVYNLISERDFARENIMLSDKDEIQKLSDKISYDAYGVKGKYGGILDWKSMNELFGGGFQGELKRQQATMSYCQDGTFQLMCHGITDQSYNSLNKVRLDGKEVDAERAAKIILNELEGYDIITKYTNRPLVVVIHACGVGGKSADSFASKLSGYLAEKSLNIYVVAAPGDVYPVVGEFPNYSEIVKDKTGKAVNWNCFHGGKFISEGEKDFSKTVTKVQKDYSK